MKDCRGVSLVELIVVIAIIALLAGASTAGWNYVSYADTSKCAKELNSLLMRTRVQAMSMKEKPYIYLYKKEENYYYSINTKSSFSPTMEWKKVANKKVKISYDDGSGTYTDLADGGYIKLTFKKSSGAFDFGSIKYKSIKIEGSSIYTIFLYETTGKTKIE